MCFLWKVGKSPEKFGGKKVKCKCGTVGLVPQPVSADDDLLNMDLGEIQYQAVAPAKPKSKPGQNKSGKKNSGKKRLTKRQREDKSLAESLVKTGRMVRSPNTAK